jgi:hypothetical protein
VTQANPFLDILNKGGSPPDNRQPALDILEKFRQAIEQHWNGQIDCKIALGYPTNFGQEYRIVIVSRGTRYEHTLLRAYIPLLGRPIKLDLYNFQMVDCPDLPTLQDALENFLAKDETRAAIDTYSRS